MGHIPQISVIIPTHNRAKYLPETINSVLEQTYRDIEVIVVDDGSTDETAEVVNAYDDPRVFYIHQMASGLPAAARNTGMRFAKGNWIALLDDDDIWLPEKLEKQSNYIHGAPGTLFVCTNATYFSEAGELGMAGEDTDQVYTFREIFLGNKVVCSSALMHHSLFDKCGYFDEDPVLRSVEDYDHWICFAQDTPLHYLGEQLVRYRVHPENISTNLINAYLKDLEIFERWMKKASKGLQNERLMRIYFGMGRAYLDKDDKEYKTYFKKSIEHSTGGMKMNALKSMLALPTPVFKKLFKKAYQSYRGDRFTLEP